MRTTMIAMTIDNSELVISFKCYDQIPDCITICTSARIHVVK